MTNFRKTALALASAFMMAGAAGAAGLPDILERDAAGTSAAQKAGAELARLVDGKDEKPEGVFRASALRVVRRWAFMPPAEPAWQRLTIRYELEK